MFDEHARVLRYYCWFSAGLVALGFVIEGLKSPAGVEPAAAFLLLVISGLCEAMAFAEWRSDRVLESRRS
ncbi:hypothetical protein [Croceicoccus gelatinilyticus]|uniref:hypothetical protein n=1 Tax=Croceicoccus gelatinilyticus TaxID=2835536 RepID=UPI001BCE197E|nr:hypothetical protein [Croceicoccus gelatinilyticus]MBS7669993.1 hypothetical protein [Croceicoccus gelatinilyticus]